MYSYNIYQFFIFHNYMAPTVGFHPSFLCIMFLLLCSVIYGCMSWETELKKILTCTKQKCLPTFTFSWPSIEPLQSSTFSADENSTEFLTDAISCISCSSAFSWQKDTQVYNDLKEVLVLHVFSQVKVNCLF